MKNKSFTAFFLSLFIIQLFLPSGIAISKAFFEPYQKTFIVTAYYSPLEGQDFYVTGSLAGDKRLNGNGTNGADGTPVYPGMIAAPSTYAFGTRVSCPGYIDGEIHDRGGAIVKAGVRSNAHDRLDFWAGHGDAALKTALYWGKRTLTCTVYPPGYSGDFQQYVSLPNAPTQFGKPQMASRYAEATQQVVPTGMPERYKKYLSELGYDPENKASRIAFQMRHNIISSPTESVAGNIGPQTKTKLDEIFSAIKENTPAEDLEMGEVSNEVRKLQEILNQLGYLNTDSTAIFAEQTKAAVIKFQVDQGLIESIDHPAAGYIGPGTHAALKEKAMAPFKISPEDQELIALLDQDRHAAESLAKANALEQQSPEESDEGDDYTELLKALSSEWIKEHTPSEQSSQAPIIKLASKELVPEQKLVQELKAKLAPVMNPFTQHLQLGSKGEEVKNIQTFLQQLGYFEGELITDYFGPQTKKALAQFQIDLKIVKTAQSPGAGTVGPKTLQALNASYYQEQFSLPFEVSNIFRAPAINPEDISAPLQQAQTGTTKAL